MYLTIYFIAKLEADTQRTRAEGLQGSHPSPHNRSTIINHVLADLKRLLGQGRRVSKLYVPSLALFSVVHPLTSAVTIFQMTDSTKSLSSCTRLSPVTSQSISRRIPSQPHKEMPPPAWSLPLLPYVSPSRWGWARSSSGPLSRS